MIRFGIDDNGKKKKKIEMKMKMKMFGEKKGGKDLRIENRRVM
jgi:hypothetical protein